ncbi:MAG: glycoside hydrolase family 2, partial [Candidatus Gallimonas sp.]
MNAKCYKKGYPRPKFVRERYERLDGVWDFTFDESQGERFSQLKQGKGFDRKITVPYSYQTKKSGIGVDEDYPVVWYARTFRSAHGQG